MDALLDAAPCGFLVVGDDGHVRIANATMARMLGMEASALAGRHVDFLLATPSRVFYQTHVFPTLRLQGTVHEVYVSMLALNGQEVPVLLNARRREEGGQTVSDWAVVPMRQRNEYENEILKARRAAEDALRAKDEFLGLVSHELRSPLSAIRNWTSILRKKSDPATLERGLEAIERNVLLQTTLVNDILDEVRAMTGKLQLRIENVDARRLVHDVLEAAAPTAQVKGIELVREIPTSPMLVRGDSERLQQVIWNVAANAVKFTPSGGTVRAVVSRVADWVEVAVSDTGKGISPEFLPHVFERFRQEDRVGGTAQGGLGLGMAITRKLVELHGGSIFALSPGEGLGSTFTVRLPAA